MDVTALLNFIDLRRAHILSCRLEVQLSHHTISFIDYGASVKVCVFDLPCVLALRLWTRYCDDLDEAHVTGPFASAFLFDDAVALMGVDVMEEELLYYSRRRKLTILTG